jgi:surface polysaccharide O-acyltransferase-like enzyme
VDRIPGKNFYTRRFLSVVPQYLIFSLIAVLFTFAGTVILKKPWDESFFDILYQLFTGTAYYHLWFLILIVQLYALYPVIERIFSLFVKKGKIIELFLILFISQVVLQMLAIDKTSLLWTSTLFLRYIFYFVLGMHVRSINWDYSGLEKVSKYAGLVFFILVFSTVIEIGDLYKSDFSMDFSLPLNLITAIETPVDYLAIFALCLFVAIKIKKGDLNLLAKPLQLIGNFSFGIYHVHVFILVFLVTLISPKIGLTIDNPLFFPVVFFLVLFFSICAVHIIKNIPFHEFMIGY